MFRGTKVQRAKVSSADYPRCHRPVIDKYAMQGRAVRLVPQMSPDTQEDVRQGGGVRHATRHTQYSLNKYSQCRYQNPPMSNSNKALLTGIIWMLNLLMLDEQLVLKLAD